MTIESLHTAGVTSVPEQARATEQYLRFKRINDIIDIEETIGQLALTKGWPKDLRIGNLETLTVDGKDAFMLFLRTDGYLIHLSMSSFPEGDLGIQSRFTLDTTEGENSHAVRTTYQLDRLGQARKRVANGESPIASDMTNEDLEKTEIALRAIIASPMFG